VKGPAAEQQTQQTVSVSWLRKRIHEFCTTGICFGSKPTQQLPYRTLWQTRCLNANRVSNIGSARVCMLGCSIVDLRYQWGAEAPLGAAAAGPAKCYSQFRQATAEGCSCQH